MPRACRCAAAASATPALPKPHSASTVIPDEDWTTLSMPFDGYFGYCIGADVFMSGSLYRCYMRQPRLLAECRSKNHRLDLVRVSPRSSR